MRIALFTDNENTWDKLLQVKTTGRDDSNSDQYRYPYEPSPYSVLERLANSGFIRREDVVLDYGCGKGRVDFFLSYQKFSLYFQSQNPTKTDLYHSSPLTDFHYVLHLATFLAVLIVILPFFSPYVKPSWIYNKTYRVKKK